MRQDIQSGPDFGRPLSPGAGIGGRYLLKRLLGRGGISEVWLARDSSEGRDVALKFLPAAILHKPTLVAAIEANVHRNSLLDHPHIAQTFGMVRDGRSIAIAMECMEGWSLASLKVDKPRMRYRVRDIEWWIRQLCITLDYAHNERGIIHRGLKPENLFVDKEDRLKVTDFGIADTIARDASIALLSRAFQRDIGFRSPQQVMGEAPSKLDDVYSIGATIFDLLTGTPPFYKGEIIAQVTGLNPPQMNQRLRELGIKGDLVPPEWEYVVAACLSKNPGQRPKSVIEVLQMLDGVELTSANLTTSKSQEGAMVDDKALSTMDTDAGKRVTNRAKQTSRVFVLTTIVTVLLLLAMAMIWERRRPQSPQENPPMQEAPLASFRPSVVPPALDETFHHGSGANFSVSALAVQSDGKILAGGRFTHFDDLPVRYLVRLNVDGSVDETFQPELAGDARVIALQPDKKILIGGSGLDANNQRVVIVRLNTDGSLDKSFNPHQVIWATVAIAVQPNGKILIANDRTITRLNADGKIDRAFNVVRPSSGFIRAMALQADGKILVGGWFSPHSKLFQSVTRLNANGTIDANFLKCQADNRTVNAIAIQTDGKILIGGDFHYVNTVQRQGLARLNSDGSLDANLAFNLHSQLGAIRVIAVQQDGRIVVGGNFRAIEETEIRYLARLTEVGRLDTSFKIGTGVNSFVHAIAIQTDGNIVAAGGFTSFGDRKVGRIVRLFGGLAAATNTVTVTPSPSGNTNVHDQ